MWRCTSKEQTSNYSWPASLSERAGKKSHEINRTTWTSAKEQVWFPARIHETKVGHDFSQISLIHVTMEALFLDDNKTNDDGDGKEISKKWYVYMLTNNNFARASRYFVRFFTVVAPLRYETS